jgi:hypothetical protein
MKSFEQLVEEIEYLEKELDKIYLSVRGKGAFEDDGLVDKQMEIARLIYKIDIRCKLATLVKGK